MSKKSEIVGFVREQGIGGATHGMIMNRFFGGKRGTTCIILQSLNIEICHGMTDEMGEILNELLNGDIHLHATNMIVYMADGCPMMVMPVAKKPPKGGYKEPHQMFVVFYPDLQCPKSAPMWKGCPTRNLKSDVAQHGV